MPSSPKGLGLSGFSWTVLALGKLSWQAAAFMVSHWSPVLRVSPWTSWGVELRSQGPRRRAVPWGLPHLCRNGRCDSRDQRAYLASSRHQGCVESKGTCLECSSWCSGLIHVWAMLGLAQLHLLPLLVLFFQECLANEEVTSAVFWSKWKVPFSQHVFSCFCACVKQAGWVTFGGCLSSVFPGCIVSAWLPSL